MKNTKIICLLFLAISMVSCSKDNDKGGRRYIGYLYNSNDSLPFANTKFMCFIDKTTGLKKGEDREYFYTDNNGRFDYKTNQAVGKIVWPSYHPGDGYYGPKNLGALSLNARTVQDKETKVYTTYYDTIYTEPSPYPEDNQ